MVGYFGDDPGDPVIVPAGSIACFSSTLFSRSGINATDRMRRGLRWRNIRPSRSSARMAHDHGCSADPLLVDGKPVN